MAIVALNEWLPLLEKLSNGGAGFKSSFLCTKKFKQFVIYNNLFINIYTYLIKNYTSAKNVLPWSGTFNAEAVSSFEVAAPLPVL